MVELSFGSTCAPTHHELWHVQQSVAERCWV